MVTDTSPMLDWLRMTKRAMDPHKGKRCLDDFVLAHGEHFTPRELPKRIKAGEIGSCFMNATHLAVANENLAYCEGYAVTMGSIPVLHAWCVDRDGKVLDNTWCGNGKPPRPTMGAEYFGVRFETNFVRICMMATEYFGILGNERLHRTKLFPLVSADESWKRAGS